LSFKITGLYKELKGILSYHVKKRERRPKPTLPVAYMDRG